MNSLVPAKGRQGATHTLGPVAGTEFATTLGNPFDNDFFHELPEMIALKAKTVFWGTGGKQGAASFDW